MPSPIILDCDPGEITLVATDPLTNIALALRREPRLADWVRRFVIMGGSADRGNVTPAAEYNMLVPARVQVETAGKLTSGMTVTDFEAGEADEGNALVAMEIDVAAFWELTLGTYARVAGPGPAKRPGRWT